MKKSKRSFLGGLLRWGTPLTLALLLGFALGTARASADETADMLLGLKVRGSLLTHLGVDGVQIGVDAKDGRVTLLGIEAATPHPNKSKVGILADDE